MVSLKIENIKEFMSELLTGTTFDFLCVAEIKLKTFCTYSINGHINPEFYSDEELSSLKDSEFCSWKNLKSVCYQLIKGSKAPDYFKISFLLPSSDYKQILEKSSCDLTESDIQGLFIHVVYEHNIVNVITATSLNIFTLDKSLDKYWDSSITKLMDSKFQTKINI